MNLNKLDTKIQWDGTNYPMFEDFAKEHGWSISQFEGGISMMKGRKMLYIAEDDWLVYDGKDTSVCDNKVFHKDDIDFKSYRESKQRYFMGYNETLE